MSARPHVDARIALLLTVPPLMWAGNAVVGRLMVGQVPPLLLNALRWVLAALILLPFGWSLLATPARRRELLERWRPLAMLGLLGVGCYNALQYLALTTSTPLNVTLIAASSPVCMMLIGAVGYGTHPTRRELIGAALSIAGVLLVLVRGDALALTSLRFVPGDLMMLAAVLSNVVNNLPAVLVLLPLVSGAPAVLAVLIGVNIGPNLTYVGSLANLLWRRVLHHHGEQTSVREFSLLGLVTVPLCLAVGVVALWAGIRLVGV